MHTRHLPPFLKTTTTLASHSGYFASLINPAFKRLSTSAWMIWWQFGWKACTFYRTGLADGRTFNLWEALVGLIPVTFEWSQANTSAFAISTSCNRAISSSVRRELTLVHLSGPPMTMDCRGSTTNCSLSSEVAWTAGLNFYDEG